MKKYANLRSEAQGFITDWLMAPGDYSQILHSIDATTRTPR